VPYTGVVRLGLVAAIIATAAVLTPDAYGAPPAPDSLIATAVNNVQHTVALSWPNDTGQRVILQAKPDSAPQDENDGTRVYDGTGSSVTVTDQLVDQTHYFFRVFATDGTTYTPGAYNMTWTPPPPATVQSVEPVMSRRDAIYLRIANTPGCKEVTEDCRGVYAAYGVGANSPYPTAPGPFGYLRINPPNVDLLNVGSNERRVLHVSVWEVGWDEDVWGTPVHLEVRTGRWLGGLRPTTRAAPVGTSPHKAQVFFYSASERLQGYVIYGARGWQPPGTTTHPPSGKPLARCSASSCPASPCCEPYMRVIGHLADTRPFTFRVYGYDKAGHYRGAKATVIPHRRGLSVGGRAWWHVEAAYKSSIVRDNVGGYHAIDSFKYLARQPGGQWHQRHFRSVIAAGLATSPDGSRVYVAFQDENDNGDYLHVVSVPAGSTSLPRGDAGNSTPYFVGEYPEGGPPRRHYTFLAMQGLPGGRVAILMNRDDAGRLVIVRGKPGGIFTTKRLSGETANPDETFITRDKANGSLVIAARAYDDGVQGDYVWTSTGRYASAWNPATLVQPYQPGDYLTSVAANHGHVWIGLTRNAEGAKTGFRVPIYGHHSATDGAFVVRGNEKGDFGHPVRLPHTNRFATMPRLAAQGTTVYALYVAAHPGAPLAEAGMRLLRHASTGWLRPVRLTQYWKDVPLAVMPLPDGAYTYAFARH